MMEVVSVVGTIVAHPDKGAKPESWGRFRRIIVACVKAVSALVIVTIAVPALVVSVLVATTVVCASSVVRLFEAANRRSQTQRTISGASKWKALSRAAVKLFHK